MIGQVDVDTSKLEAALARHVNLIDGWTFECMKEAADKTFAVDMKQRAPRDRGDLADSIGIKADEAEMIIDVGSFGIVYAAMQEFGGVFRRVNGQATDNRTGSAHETGVIRSEFNKTKKMEAFFWYMYSSTGDSKYRAMALADRITIPAQPYIRPAFEAQWRAFVREVSLCIVKKLRQR